MISRFKDYPYGYWQRQIVKEWEQQEREAEMETTVIFREKRGKVFGEVVEKDTGENVWREMFVYRSYKDRDDKWQKTGWGERDLEDAKSLFAECLSIMTGGAAVPKTKEPEARPQSNDDGGVRPAVTTAAPLPSQSPSGYR